MALPFAGAGRPCRNREGSLTLLGGRELELYRVLDESEFLQMESAEGTAATSPPRLRRSEEPIPRRARRGGAAGRCGAVALVLAAGATVLVAELAAEVRRTRSHAPARGAGLSAEAPAAATLADATSLRAARVHRSADGAARLVRPVAPRSAPSRATQPRVAAEAARPSGAGLDRSGGAAATSGAPAPGGAAGSGAAATAAIGADSGAEFSIEAQG